MVREAEVKDKGDLLLIALEHWKLGISGCKSVGHAQGRWNMVSCGLPGRTVKSLFDKK